MRNPKVILKKYIEMYQSRRDFSKVSAVKFFCHNQSYSQFPEALFSTGTGLYLCGQSAVTQLLAGEFFGITKGNDKQIYIYQKLKYSGRVLQLKLNGIKIPEVKIFRQNLPRNIHQIDFIDGDLWLTDPSNNCIRIFDDKGKPKKHIYPLGRLKNGKQSPNYGHLNSVFSTGDKVYVVAHNYTQYSNKKSSLLILDKRSLDVVETVSDIGVCAHNTIIYGDLFLHCDSMPGQLINNREIVFTAQHFTRGLAMNHEFILLGGSMYGSKGERIGKNAFLYLLDLDFNLRCHWEFEGIGPMFDIRFIDTDYGVSNQISRNL
ncbi:MAG: hypothetical protein HUN04_03925 [Desulfobacter sp.]|nr:MAG: hypothetical protein HUN04_03925 [Desulfobacter sp.]